MPFFGRKGRSAGADLPEGQISDGKHFAIKMNADGSATTTKVPCNCSIGTTHEGPIPDPPAPPTPRG
jgi:hypothetical protein